MTCSVKVYSGDKSLFVRRYSKNDPSDGHPIGFVNLIQESNPQAAVRKLLLQACDEADKLVPNLRLDITEDSAILIDSLF